MGVFPIVHTIKAIFLHNRNSIPVMYHKMCHQIRVTVVYDIDGRIESLLKCTLKRRMNGMLSA